MSAVRNPIVVVGVGNLLMGDEGIGIRLLELLQESLPHLPDVDLVDVATSGARLLHAVAGRRKAIIVDCAFQGTAPGTLSRSNPEALRSIKELSGLSLHEGDVLEALHLSRVLGECPAEVIVFGIQPARVAPGQDLSPELARQLPLYLDAILAEISRPVPALCPSHS